MHAEIFGRMPDGEDVYQVVLSEGDLSVSVITFGAVIRDVRLAGVDHPLVLGLETLDRYIEHSPHLGAVAGRSANRIAHGRFSIADRDYQVSLNERGRTHLHGGFAGFGKRNWRLVDSDGKSVTLAIVSPDGEEGYPGTVEATLRYSLEAPGTIRMEATAVTSAATLVNLAQHSYFNLDDSADILDHQVQIFADTYTPTDADSIPTGEILSVAGSDFDFRTSRAVRRERKGERVVYDMNFVVARRKSGALRTHARLASPASGLSLTVSSTEPGVQFYDGSWMNVPVPGLGGRRYGVNAGCCFEPQFFPDAPNHPGFPSSILRPGETYRQTTTFAFART
jgi:aldose 1-epimerase